MEDSLAAFNLERTYYYGDVVIHQGVRYFAVAESVSGEYPHSSTNWGLFMTSSEMLSEQVYQELRDTMMDITQSYRTIDPWSASDARYWTAANTSTVPVMAEAEIAKLVQDINSLKHEVAQIKKELRTVRSKSEEEHRKLSV